MSDTISGFNIFAYKYYNYCDIPEEAKNFKKNNEYIYNEGHTIISILNTVDILGAMTLRFNPWDSMNDKYLEYCTIDFNNYPNKYTNFDMVISNPGNQNHPVYDFNIYVDGTNYLEPHNEFRPIFHIAGESRLTKIVKLYDIKINEIVDATIIQGGNSTHENTTLGIFDL